MPNYCLNEVKFDCSGILLEEILDFIREPLASYKKRWDAWYNTPEAKPYRYYSPGPLRLALDFNNILPYPEKYQQEDEDYDKLSREEFLAKYNRKKPTEDGYNWRLNNWGTKSNVGESVYFNKRESTLVFKTAWLPAIKVISALHERFPTVTMYYEYYEKGTGFIGGCEFVCEADFDSDYHYSNKSASNSKEFSNYLSKDSELKWKAGVPLNIWGTDYMGFKGG